MDDRPSDRATEIATRIELARRAAGLTQEEVGARLGYRGTSARQMGHALEHKPPAAWVRLALLADTLGVSADWLLGRVPRFPEMTAEGPEVTP